MKKVLLLLVAAAFAIIGRAATYDMVTVHLADETTVDIAMTEGLQLSFDATDLHAVGSGAEVTISKANILKIEHTSTQGVEDAVADAGFEFSDGLHFRNLPAGSTVVICDLAGRVELSVAAEGDFSLPLDALVPGIHIVNVNGVSYKINVK